MMTVLSPPAAGIQAAASMVRHSVTATKSWNSATREAMLSSMSFWVQWNKPMGSLVEPMLGMTREAHEQWLGRWESQCHEMIDRTFQRMDPSATTALHSLSNPKVATK